MKSTTLNHIMIIVLAAAVASGCVANNRRLERQGTKAYIAKDFQTAQTKYTEAIAEGSVKANYHLAVMYAEGKGVRQDYEMTPTSIQLHSYC